jgi:thymidylate kinase
MRVIQVRGTNGTGKSTVVKEVINRIGQWQHNYTEGRKRPLYSCHQGWLYVLGHYEVSCGGCDTLGSARQAYEVMEQIRRLDERDKVIIAEGILLAEDTKWTLEMAKWAEVRIAYLTTPIDECMERIRKRREGSTRASTKPLNPNKTPDRARLIERMRLKLIAAGIQCRRVSQEQAVKVVLDWIRN